MKEFSFPGSNDLSVLALNAPVGRKTAPNRLVCQPMEGCDGTADGAPGELTRRRYLRFARGGAGILWMEATAVLREGRANPRQLFLSEQNLDAFRRLADGIREAAVKENGAPPLLILQLTHSGRYSKPRGVPEPLIAYRCPPYETAGPLPEERVLSDGALDTVGEALVNGAALAERAGFDGADIKSCHRYLLSELLSAHTRPGRYGGDFTNRTRLLLESVKGARQVCGGDFLICTRVNAYDGLPYPWGFGVSPEGGLDFCPDEPARLLELLRDAGADLVNVTMGNPYVNPHVNRPFKKGPYAPPEPPETGVARLLEGTKTLKRAVPVLPLIASGFSYLGDRAANVAAAYIGAGDFDFAGFGRTAFAYPDFAKDILVNGGMKKEKCCICCSKCSEIMRPGGTPGCAVRDGGVYAPIYTETCGRKNG